MTAPHSQTLPGKTKSRVRLRPMSPHTEVLDVQPLPGSLDPVSARFATQETRSGVVHVGAHTGEELEQYIAAGFKKIMLVEANPAIIPRLTMHVGFWNNWLGRFSELWGVETPEIRIANVAASSTAGFQTFYVSAYPVLSSLLPPLTSAFGSATTTEVPAARLDDLVSQAGWAHSEISLVVIDAQGAELAVLQGAPMTAKHARCIVGELNMHERYLHQSPSHQVISHMSFLGFSVVEIIDRDDAVGRLTVLFQKDGESKVPVSS